MQAAGAGEMLAGLAIEDAGRGRGADHAGEAVIAGQQTCERRLETAYRRQPLTHIGRHALLIVAEECRAGSPER